MFHSLSTAPVKAPAPPEDACYLALRARDARFDGSFFAGVTSTGIYCRPVCRVRTPRRENCRFFALAAQAEQAGFRPCLRCRPELAPRQWQAGQAAAPWSTQDASAILVQQATRWLDTPEAWGESGPSMTALAGHLGVSDRHLRRIFEAQLGVSPLQYLQTRRLLMAKQLLTDTGLSVGQIAMCSGYASIRRFNAAFAGHYRLSPSQLRSQGGGGGEQGVTVRLGYRPPYDIAALLAFFQKRLVPGIEEVRNEAQGHSITRSFRIQLGAKTHVGWLHAQFDLPQNRLALQVSDSLCEALPQVISRVRCALDLDADPLAINAVLHTDFPDGDGLRVPGALDAFELAVRAILGQQVTVAAARTLTQRLVLRLGEPLSTPWPGVNRLFPCAASLVSLGQAAGETLGELGIVRQRQKAILALAEAVHTGQLQLHAGVDVPRTLAQLTELPGIGDWTAQYIAMRALRWPDAFPAGDVALQSALGLREQPKPALAATALAQQWRPWRSYAVVRAWARGWPGTDTTTVTGEPS
jgi:AraC family transcriptional regulator of adaptative response / DNA-3-methyladenine glycosylase II